MKDYEKIISDEIIDLDISTHIFSGSITMIGVCLTVISLIRVNNTLRQSESLSDNFLFLNIILYLVSGFLSYMSIRSKKKKNKSKFNFLSDISFLFSISLTVIICGYIVFEKII